MDEQGKKKTNTAIFMLLATLGNVVLMFVFFIIGFVLLARFGNPESESGNFVWIMLIFVLSIGLSWLIYSRFVKWYTKRVDVDKKFAPLFTSKRVRQQQQRQKKEEASTMKD